MALKDQVMIEKKWRFLVIAFSKNISTGEFKMLWILMFAPDIQEV